MFKPAAFFRAISFFGCAVLPFISGCQSQGKATRSHEPNVPVASATPKLGTELEKALASAPQDQRDGLQFLIDNMPEQDRSKLSAGYLLENVSLAYEAWQTARWHDQIPKEIFLNEILPYASINESRDDWRKQLREKCLPLVADCKTPSEAAQKLNQKLFKLVKVKYSTERRKADQSPLESMQSGLASCTGLSVLLIDACRSVGVPARLVGTPLWYNKRGNHTWVEIWDQRWHFTGAAEPDPKGLDRGWFTHDASQALKDIPEQAIYATSFKKTGLSFPMVWAPRIQYVSAINVTESYAAKSKPPEIEKVRLVVKVLDRPTGKRVATKVRVTDPADPKFKLEGTSRNESADSNDILPFEISKNHSYIVEAEQDGNVVRKHFTAKGEAQPLLLLTLSEAIHPVVASMGHYVRPPVTMNLKSFELEALRKSVTEFFSASPEQQKDWKFSSSLDELLATNEPAVREETWDAYRSAPIHEDAKKDFDTNQVRFEKHLSAYTVKTVGTRPTNGWPLFIAMHGGGGAPKALNDSQWEHMKIYYKDHPEAGGYLYLALRAPNDTWNGFYDVYVYPLIENLIQQFLLFRDVDPNKVFIMGYSHGGYGAFAIGPKIPYRFAAVHASASAPTDGETTGKTLRNTIFSYMVGDQDTMYGRYDRCIKFRDQIEKLRGDRKDVYPVTFQLIKGNGHGGLPDRDKIKEMYPAIRNPVPRELTWLMTDKVVKNFFWLHAPAPGKKQEIDALCRENHLTVTTTTNVTAATVFLDSRLIDFSKPVAVDINAKTSALKLKPSLLTLCQTMAMRGDPELAFTAKIDLDLSPPPSTASAAAQ
jgi:hypothetical protein